METKTVESLSQLLLSPVNLAVMVAAWMTISLVRNILPKLAKKKTFIRFLPVMPVALCMGYLSLPGVRPDDVEWGWILVLGMVLGWGTGHLHKVLEQTVLGHDSRLDVPKGEGSSE